MCTVSINIDEAMMRLINPGLTDSESINRWLQHQVDLMLKEMMVADTKTMDVEELRGMVHEAIPQDYECGRAESRRQALKKDMTPEQLYSVISEEIDDIYANG